MLEPITGRYVHVELGGRRHRMYFEEAGAGWPLLCLHTAGADGRQFRHLMTDDAITRSWRVLAFDMPCHGKSLPPAGWQDEEYRLTTDAYVEMILAFCDSGLSISPATCAAMNRLISPSTPATIRNTSPRSDFDVT